MHLQKYTDSSSCEDKTADLSLQIALRADRARDEVACTSWWIGRRAGSIVSERSLWREGTRRNKITTHKTWGRRMN